MAIPVVGRSHTPGTAPGRRAPCWIDGLGQWLHLTVRDRLPRRRRAVDPGRPSTNRRHRSGPRCRRDRRADADELLLADSAWIRHVRPLRRVGVLRGLPAPKGRRVSVEVGHARQAVRADAGARCRVRPQRNPSDAPKLRGPLGWLYQYSRGTEQKRCTAAVGSANLGSEPLSWSCTGMLRCDPPSCW